MGREVDALASTAWRTPSGERSTSSIVPPVVDTCSRNCLRWDCCAGETRFTGSLCPSLLCIIHTLETQVARGHVTLAEGWTLPELVPVSKFGVGADFSELIHSP